MAKENTDAIYRCPKGGFHKWGKRKMRWWIIGWVPLIGSPRVLGGNTRRCVKCGTTIGPDGVISDEIIE